MTEDRGGGKWSQAEHNIIQKLRLLEECKIIKTLKVDLNNSNLTVPPFDAITIRGQINLWAISAPPPTAPSPLFACAVPRGVFFDSLEANAGRGAHSLPAEPPNPRRGSVLFQRMAMGER